MEIRTQGVVLSRKRVGDSDLIITIFTKTQGKVRLYVNGARHLKSRFHMVTHPFVSASFLYKDKGELGTLLQADLDKGRIALREDYDRLMVGTYMLELIEVSTELGDPVARLFDLVDYALDALVSAQDLALLRAVYTLKVVQRLGFEPQVDQCASCGDQEALLPLFSVAMGGVICRSCAHQTPDARRVSVEALKWINVALKSPYATVQASGASDTMMSSVNKLLDAYVEAHVARRRLKSLELLTTP